MTELSGRRENIEVDFRRYLTGTPAGDALDEAGLYQPPKNSEDNILAGTTDDYENLRVGEARCSV